MSDENSHAQGIIAQLRMAEEDEELSDEQRESARQRREELEGNQ